MNHIDLDRLNHMSTKALMFIVIMALIGLIYDLTR